MSVEEIGKSYQDRREAALPKWVRDLIDNLRKQLADGREPLVKQLNKLERDVKLYRSRAEAITELLECAAQGKHITASTVVEILGTYDLVLAPTE